MKTNKKSDKKLGILGSYTPGLLVELLNSEWSDLNESSREIVETIERANMGLASADVAEELAKKIDVYQFRPRLRWEPLSLQGWSVSWNMKLMGEPNLRLVAYLFEAAVHGELRRFRRCAWEKCGRWFFQRPTGSPYCSSDCTELARRASPEYLEKQRRIMSKRYRQSKADALGISLVAYERRLLRKRNKK